MMKLVLGLLLTTSLFGAIWPEQIGAYKRVSTKPVAVTENRALWDEYGFDTAEQAQYENGAEKFSGTLYRLKDSTGAHAAAQWLKGTGAPYITHGNYVFRFEGKQPEDAVLQPFFADLPKLEQSPLPTVTGYLPAANRIPNSERYILGPVSLEQFAPAITPSLAAFHFGAEGQLARFRDKDGETTLAIFSYPTPHIARARMPDFQMLEGAVARRSGPLVAVALKSVNPDAAQRLLSQVKYQATISWDETPAPTVQEASNMILDIFVLAGVLILASLILGFAFGGFRILARRLGFKVAQPDEMTTLHLGDRS
jgi:hypothetical protein